MQSVEYVPTQPRYVFLYTKESGVPRCYHSDNFAKMLQGWTRRTACSANMVGRNEGIALIRPELETTMYHRYTEHCSWLYSSFSYELYVELPEGIYK